MPKGLTDFLASLWRVDNDVCGLGSGHLRLIPCASAILVGEPVHHLGGASCRWLVDDGTDGGCRDGDCGCDCCCGCDRVVAAASATVVAAAVVVAVRAHVDVAVHIYVVVYVGVAIDVVVGVVVYVVTAIRIVGGIGIGSAIRSVGICAIGAATVDAAVGGAASLMTTSVTPTTTTTTAATSALRGETGSEDQADDDEYGKETDRVACIGFLLFI